MQQKSLKFKLLFITLISSLGMILLSSVSFYSVQTQTKDIKDVVYNTVPIVRDLTLIDMVHDGIRSFVVQAKLGQVTQKTKLIDEAKDGLKEHETNAQKYFQEIQKKKTSVEFKNKEKIAQAEMSKYINTANEFISLAANPASELSEQKWHEFNEQFDSLEKNLEEFGEFAEQESEKSLAEKINFGTRMSWLNMIISLLTLLTSVFLSLAVAGKIAKNFNNLTEKLDSTSTSINQVSSEVNQATLEVTKAINEQVVAIKQTSAAAEEASSTVQQTAQRSVEVEKTTEKSKQYATDGKNTVDRLQIAMNNLNQANETSVLELTDSNKKIESITTTIKEVADKTRVINDIVFQTKLLSFNASVEAARAGEHGKGFAVVAEEVGNLALMSGQAAAEINVLLDSCVNHVTATVKNNKDRVEKLISETSRLIIEGKEVTNQCQEALNHILDSSTQVSQMIEEISTASQHSARSVEEIKTTILQIENKVQLSSQGTEKCVKANKKLHENVQSLKNTAADFKQEIHAHKSKTNSPFDKSIQNNIHNLDTRIKNKTRTSSNKQASGF